MLSEVQLRAGDFISFRTGGRQSLPLVIIAFIVKKLKHSYSIPHVNERKSVEKNEKKERGVMLAEQLTRHLFRLHSGTSALTHHY